MFVKPRTPKAPGADGEVLCDPPAAAWTSLARQNRAALSEPRRFISGVPFAAWRAAARRETLEMAIAYTRRLGAVPDVADPDALLIATGHQPVFFHPGIWIKNLIVEACAGPGVAALNIIVDSDEAGSVTARAPRRNGQLRQTRRVLFEAPPGAPFEALPVPIPAAWHAFVDAVRGDAASVPLPGALARLDRLAEAGRRELATASNLGDFLGRVRRSLEVPAGRPYRLLEVPVSQIAAAPSFRAFFAEWVRGFEDHGHATNTALGAHRASEGIRSAVQPFPNLGHADGRFELPFWVIRGGRRQPLLARRASGVVELSTPAERLLGIRPDEIVDAISESGLAIRPRALTLTMFARVGAVDLFVHGIGGARYDRATDRVARAFFGFEPPAFAVATATFRLSLGAGDDAGAARLALQRRLIALRHNPERFLDGAADQPLVAEKWDRIRELSGAFVTRRARRAATRRIRDINADLAARLEPESAAARAELDRWAVRAAEEIVARDREYPYFFFDAEDLAAAARRLTVERAAR